MDINVKVMQEGEVARQIDGSTVIAEEGQVMLSISGGGSVAIALLEPATAAELSSRLRREAAHGSTMRWLTDRKAGRIRIENCRTVPHTPSAADAVRPSFWAALFGTRA